MEKSQAELAHLRIEYGKSTKEVDDQRWKLDEQRTTLDSQKKQIHEQQGLVGG